MTEASRVAPDPADRSTSRTVWFNCAAGVAGDMLLAALIDAGADRLAVMDAWAQLELDGFAATWERVDRCGVSALWTNIVIDQTHNFESDATHPGGDHRHTEHGHRHRPAKDVIAMMQASGLDDTVRTAAIRVYRLLAATEAAIHQQSPDEVELHEVGAIDSILDVVGVCAALNDLGADEVSYSPIGIGAGLVNTAHGLLPHPAPATARLLAEHGADVVGLATTLETATPTGVALLTALGVASPAPPAIEVHAVGYGAGTANPTGRANVVQALVGSRPAEPVPLAPGSRVHQQQLVVIETNVDDVTGETVAFTIERLLDTGALDAWATPILMKKHRPAFTVHVLSLPAMVDTLRTVLTDETGSLGARVRYVERAAHDRAEHDVTVDGHRIRIKVAGHRFKVEFADAAAAARATGRPLRSVIADAERVYRDQRQPDGRTNDATVDD